MTFLYYTGIPALIATIMVSIVMKSYNFYEFPLLQQVLSPLVGGQEVAEVTMIEQMLTTASSIAELDEFSANVLKSLKGTLTSR